MNKTKQIIDNHDKCILNPSKHINDTENNTNTKETTTTTAHRRTQAHLTETASNHLLSTKPPSHVRKAAPLKYT